METETGSRARGHDISGVAVSHRREERHDLRYPEHHVGGAAV